MPLFEGFEQRRIQTGPVAINLRIGGDGPPLLLMHGYPQTHVMWHRVAPRLAEDFTVVAVDLRGYGDSDKPAGDPEHENYAKRTMALDQVRVMEALGFEGFRVVGHDRGGRVGHRMALDHPARVERLAVLDIVPTYKIFMEANRSIAMKYYHWYFLAQPHPLPETLIGNSLDVYLKAKMGAWGSDAALFHPEAFAEYRRCFGDPQTIHASCEDYRAAATIDLAHDADDLARKVDCPLFAMWGGKGVMEQEYDVIACWRERAANVSGTRIDGAGHFLVEEKPAECLEALLPFLEA